MMVWIWVVISTVWVAMTLELSATGDNDIITTSKKFHPRSFPWREASNTNLKVPDWSGLRLRFCWKFGLHTIPFGYFWSMSASKSAWTESS